MRLIASLFLLAISATAAAAEEAAVIVYCDPLPLLNMGRNQELYGLGRAESEGEAAAAAMQACIAKGGSADCCKVIAHTMPQIDMKCISLAITSKGIETTMKTNALGDLKLRIFPFGTGSGKKSNEADAMATGDCISKGGKVCAVRVGTCVD